MVMNGGLFSTSSVKAAWVMPALADGFALAGS